MELLSKRRWTTGSAQQSTYMEIYIIFFLGGGWHKHNSFLLGLIQPTSPSTKELHARVIRASVHSLTGVAATRDSQFPWPRYFFSLFSRQVGRMQSNWILCLVPSRQFRMGKRLHVSTRVKLNKVFPSPFSWLWFR